MQRYWQSERAKRRIELINNVLTEEALEIYRDFAASGALVYNGRQGNPAARD
ncbi:MAG: hypothetical protein IPK19_07410 [Chloroflexi bacterium]|nr:hypothetical protein [Chloroflexota bacterium]